MSTSRPLRSFEYALVDVFAERPLEGNMLAIFTDARGLSDAEMQALARETNLAETTFILPAESPDQEHKGVRVRIFTTQEELPFAGHPTLGTASWLFWNHPTLRGAEAITLDLKGGPVTVRFRASDAAMPGVFGTMQQRDPVFGSIHTHDEVARVIGVPLDDLDEALPVQTVSTGLPFCIVPLRSLAALQRLEIPQAAAQAYLANSDAKFFYVIAPRKPGSGADFRARMQFYNGEDPATGSASGCAISYLVRHGVVSSGRETMLEQGIEILRPSQIFVQAALTDGHVGRVFVGGRTIPVASGQFSLP
jgi:trans-2,3-dihydro-3-hydroxyanthranilate isomerase